MKRTLTANESTPVDPRGLSVLAYVRVRPSNFDSLAENFVAWPQSELLALLDSLCRQKYLLRDLSGRYWVTPLAIELLNSQHIVAALEEDPPPEPVRMVEWKPRTANRQRSK